MSDRVEEENSYLGFKCPVCKVGDILLRKTVYNLPDQDKMLIIKFECNNCEFIKRDVIPLTTRMDPGIITLKINNENDLKSKIYRSPTGKLEISELDIEVEPGPNADFYYTNVEGVLFRFEQAVEIYYHDLDDNDPEKNDIREILEDLQKAMNGNLEFTLKITDLGGGSYILPVDKSKYNFEKIKDTSITNN